MKLNRTQAIELHSALSQKGLKAKHISGDNFIKLLKVKSTLKNSIAELVEAERELSFEYDATQTTEGFFVEDKEKRKEFTKNLNDKQKAYSVDVETNFIPIMELKEYTKDQDTEFEAVLFEYLLSK